MPFACSRSPLWLFAVSIACVAAGEVPVKDRAELAKALQGAQPGTVILVAPGKYAGGLLAAKVSGEKGKPIVIKAADAKQPPVFEGGQSGIHLSGCSHIELSHLTFTGAKANGLNIDDGGSRENPARGIVLRNLIITDVARRGIAMASSFRAWMPSPLRTAASSDGAAADPVSIW